MPESKPQFISIPELAARSGISVSCAGNEPVVLNDPDSVWFIDHGCVNIFLIELKDGVEQAAPQHLMSRESGCLLPGIAPDRANQHGGTTLHLIAKGLNDSHLKRLPISLLSAVDPAELAEQFDTWVSAMTDTLSRFTKPLPRPTKLANLGSTRILAPCTLSVPRGVVWISQPPSDSVLFMDIVNHSDIKNAAGSQEAVIPLTRSSWLTLLQDATLNGHSSETLAKQQLLIPALASFHAVALALERLNRRLAVADDVNLERARTASRRTAEKAARQRLFNIYDMSIDRDEKLEDTALVDALQIVGKHEGIEFKIPKRSEFLDVPVRLTDVLTASGVRGRRVQLKDQGKWWWSDSSALLAYRADDDQPVALLPGKFGRYREIDPVSHRSVRLTAERAGALKDEAWMFYSPLPSGDVEPTTLFKSALRGSSADVVRLVFAGLPYGLIRMLPALALGFVASQVSVGANAEPFYILAAVLAVFGLLGALLHMLQSMAMMRIESRSASRIEATFWDHLMRLPAQILKRYPAGDLAMSGMTFQNIRDGLQGVVADSILSVIFLLPVFGVIFFYDATLGGIALVFSLISLVITVVIGCRQVSPYGRMASAARRVAGRLFRIIGGITKLRVESAEGSAFAIWARDYREQKRASIELGSIEEHSRAFSAALPFLAGGVLLYAVAVDSNRELPVGDFLVVYTIFIIFQSAVARLGESFGTIAGMLPALDQMRPLLGVSREIELEGESVDYLGGDVLFDRISFRYDAEGPLILDDVSIHAKPGEFVAIAGESGAGKSTLFRLALGIDWPSAGAVYYDGRDLRHLNLKQLRQKIGAVPQSVGLHPQDLWDNLVSHHDRVSNEEVWEAIRLAGVETEIKAMPMGLMTMVGTSAAVLSGGESQRVTIARSVIGNPRVMLLDEATNWLDNEIQAQVMRNLIALTSTRIVIAHRLSTLQQADRIYVLQGGKVVQCGSFTELMAVKGVFQGLMKRQIA